MPKFQVLRGVHSEGKRVYGPKDQKTGEDTQPDGDVVDSMSDLSKYNIPGSPPKFRLVEEAEPEPKSRAKPKEKAEASASS